MPTMHRVVALVDWDTARRVIPKRNPDIRALEDVFSKLQTAITNHISRREKKDGYRIYWRIYHGWFQGKTKTADRVLFEKYALSASSRTLKNVSFSTDYEFSDFLSCQSKRAPIFDTSRFDRETKETKQKMVDTMLVCDLLHLVRTKDCSLILVIANDDDFVPALFTAEAWNGQVVLLHNRDQTNSFLKLTGIAERMNFE